MKIQHFYVNPAILLSGLYAINYIKHGDNWGEKHRLIICVRFYLSEVRSWWWCWVSLQLFGVSPWDLCLLGSRHSEACPHTETPTYMQQWISCRTLDTDYHPSQHPPYNEEIILKIVHCIWSRTLASLSYLNISTKHVWGGRLSGNFVNRDQRERRPWRPGLANTISARGKMRACCLLLHTQH